MYNWSYNKSLSKTLYEQLVDYFKDLISSGTLAHGQTLLSQRDYCKLFKVSRPTIDRAFEILAEERYICIQPRKKAVVQVLPEHSSSVNWEEYAKTSLHREHDPVLKKLSSIRGSSNILNLYECYFGQEFHPYAPVKEAMELALRHMPPYYHHTNLDIRGTLPLRQAICNHLTGYEIFANPSQVFVCSTLQSAYNMLFSAIGSKDMNCYVEDESIFKTDEKITGFNHINLPMDKSGILPAVLEEHLNARRKGILVIDTHYGMPSGITYSLGRRKEILKLSAAHSLPVIESEVIRDCWHETPPLPSLKSMDVYQNVVYIFTLARPFMSVMMTAIIAPESLIPVLIDTKLQNDEFTDIISQQVLEKLLTHNIYNDYMSAIRPLLIAKRDATDKLLHKHFDGLASWEKPDYGTNCRLNFDFNISPLFSSLEKEGILIYPPQIFSSKRNFIWFCYTGLELDKLDYAFEKIAKYAKKLIHK